MRINLFGGKSKGENFFRLLQKNHASHGFCLAGGKSGQVNPGRYRPSNIITAIPESSMLPGGQSAGNQLAHFLSGDGVYNETHFVRIQEGELDSCRKIERIGIYGRDLHSIEH